MSMIQQYYARLCDLKNTLQIQLLVKLTLGGSPLSLLQVCFAVALLPFQSSPVIQAL